VSEATWLRVWLQGGAVDDWSYYTLVEPPERVRVLRNPFHDGEWIRVVGDWPDAIEYERVRAVEQLDDERIFYPVGDCP
jgi:hypothetical protein